MTRFSDSFIEDLRDRLPISEVVGTRVSWDKRKTNQSRRDFWACCPMHGENSPSFHCEDRKGRYHCFGCGASGDHFRFFMELDGVSFPRAVEMVAELAGVPLPDQRPLSEAEKREQLERARKREREKLARERQEIREKSNRSEMVRDIWDQARPIEGTPAETYLRGRGIPAMAWPKSMRFHASTPFRDERHPALICGVQANDRKLVAVWRIILKPDGSPFLDEHGRKVKLGLGPAQGGAVRLGPVGEEISVCEGVETGFGVGCLNGWRRSVWPLLSTSGMSGWTPPEGVKRVFIYADGDRHKPNVEKDTVAPPPGREAAHKLRDRLKAIGVEVVVYEAPRGSDWLDVWATRQKADAE